MHLEDSPVLRIVDSALPKIMTLTPRQELIRGLASKGFSNRQIAQEIGFSESLVRQETIAIYSALRISGRDDLIKMAENETK